MVSVGSSTLNDQSGPVSVDKFNEIGCMGFESQANWRHVFLESIIYWHFLIIPTIQIHAFVDRQL